MLTSDFLPEKITREILQSQFENQTVSPVEVDQSQIRTDVAQHLATLDASIQVESPVLFEDYLNWYQVLRDSYGKGKNDVSTFLTTLQTVLVKEKAEEVFQQILPFLEFTRQSNPSNAERFQESFLPSGESFASAARQYFDAVLIGERRLVFDVVNSFLDQGISLKDLYLSVFQPVQRELGRLWQLNELTIAQEHTATALTQLMMNYFFPQALGAEQNGLCVVAASVGTEMHAVGLRMVADFFELAGWKTIYLGANNPSEAIIQTVQQSHADVLALSATLPSHVTEIQSVIAAARRALSADLKIIVGGYPFNIDPQAWQRVGADGYAVDAEGAVQAANRLILKNIQ